MKPKGKETQNKTNKTKNKQRINETTKDRYQLNL